jgi:hypothetical protein
MSDYADGGAEGVAEGIQLSDLFKKNSNFEYISSPLKAWKKISSTGICFGRMKKFFFH